MKYIYINIFFFFGILGISIQMNGQQNDDLKFNYDNQFLRNPGALSPGYQMIGSVNYLRQFSGVDSPPTTMLAAFQLPLRYQQLSIGAGLLRESAGLLTNTSLNLSSSYKLRSIASNRDALSIGLTFKMSTIGINGVNIQVVDGQDPLAFSNNENAQSFNVGIGAFYTTQRFRDWSDKKVIFEVGLSSIQALPQNLNFPSISYDEETFYFGHINFIKPISAQGTRFESIVEVFYEGSNLLNVNLAGQFIYNNAFISGFSADMNYDIGFNLGYQFSPSFTDGYYKLVAYAIVPMSVINNSINSGYGITLTYGFDTSWDR